MDPAIKLLVVEDDPAMLLAFKDVLEGAGYDVITASNGEAALALLELEQPALILSDISMPIMDGYKFLEALRQHPRKASIPFIFLTAKGTREDTFYGRSQGGDDYITKPVTTKELLSAVKARLDRSAELKIGQLKAAYKDSLFVLANAIEMRDAYTHAHMHRLGRYSRALAKEMAWDEHDLERLEFGAILHDIGKIYISDSILSKTGKLNKEEWAEMRKHPEVGARMIRDIPYLAASIPLVRHHHERWDGDGYPDGLIGDEIPLGARLLAVADAFDAMTSDRPYRKALSTEQAFTEIVDGAGKQFDPIIVEALQRCRDSGTLEDIIKSSNGHF